jgi:uncharacterized protein
MSEINQTAPARGDFADRAITIDAGLRAYMIRVYNYMAAAVTLSGVAAWMTYLAAGGDAIRIVPGGFSGLTSFGQALFGPMMIMLLLATLGLVFFISFRIEQLKFNTGLTLFGVYAAMLGVTLAPIFILYTGASITRMFFISAASFGALSLWAYTTQRDLSGLGSFLIMGLFGLILATLVNLIWPSGALGFAISVIGVGVFAGLTAYDTQRIKEMYDSKDDENVLGRKVVMGALSLYLDFINLFMMLLRLVGDRR